ncbi:branched-chain amino acid ABC transporter permease [Thermaerobacter sp. PB12/4term]|nr:branched-chain amino acid ABC transporter permease [Thermaerobacter sp. PB12/4term]
MTVLQNLVAGLSTGSLYALVAVGLVTVFKATGIINFAQGEIAMVATFLALAGLQQLGLGYWEAFVLGAAAAALLGMLLERLFLRPLLHVSAVSQIMVTIGLGMMLNGLAGLQWGYEPRAFPAPVGGAPIVAGGVAISADHLAVLAVALVVMASLFAFYRYTRLGVAVRAVAQNLPAAQLMGIPAGRVFAVSWAVAAGLGGIAGMLVAPATSLDPNFMAEVLIKGFAAAILGGITSLPGAVAGGLVLGVLETAVAGFISTDLKNVFSFTLILLVLILRPHGILGQPAARRV